MNKENKKCPKCKELLQPSQYATADFQERLVCRNYPNCEDAEVESMAEIIDR